MESERYDSIDGLRTFGCIGIMCWHIYANSNYQLPYILSEKVLPACNELVYLFMIISGFGMFAGYYEKFLTKNIDICTFYERRYKKLLPFFSLLLVVNVIAEHSLNSVIEGFTEATMLFGLLPNNELNAIGVAWTLGVIFVFYLLFPFFVFLFANKKRAWGSFLVSLVISVAVKNYYLSNQFHTESISAKHTFLYCMPLFIVGGLVYVYRDELKRCVGKHMLLYGMLSLVFTGISLGISNTCQYIDILMLKAIIIFSLWLIFAISGGIFIMYSKPIRAISAISMEVYLAHMMIFRIVSKFFRTEVLGNNLLIYVINCIVVFAILVIFILGYQYFVKRVIKYYKQISKK